MSVALFNNYYFAGSQRIAYRENGTLYFLLSDHLGSSSVTTDASGFTSAEMLYKAWGETRLGSMDMDYQYTGQRNEAGIGLYFYNARWYDPALGRFAQVDSIVPPGVQGLDRYAYVNNSPMNYVDPSGHICVESDGDSDVGMAGNCHGGSNPKYKPGLQGPKWNPRLGNPDDGQGSDGGSIGDGPGLEVGNEGKVERTSNPNLCQRFGECQSEENFGGIDWLKQLREDPNTPLYADAGQIVFGAIMEGGLLMSATGWGAVVWGIGYTGNRLSAAAGLYSTYYQYRHNLNGVVGADAWVTTSTAIIGTYPPASELVAVIQFVYDAARAGGAPPPADLEFPVIPILDEIP